MSVGKILGGTVADALALAERVWGADRPAPAVIVRAGPRAWFVVLTRVGGERDARSALGDLGYETFVPTLRREVWLKQRKVRTVREFPLFNRYVFAELPARPSEWGVIRRIEEIERVLGCNGGLPVPEGEVRRFVRAQADGAFDEARHAEERREREARRTSGRSRREEAAIRYPVGARIRALRGPFGGFAGHVTDVTGRGAVKAMVALFGGLTPVEFAIDDIEGIDAEDATHIASPAGRATCQREGAEIGVLSSG